MDMFNCLSAVFLVILVHIKLFGAIICYYCYGADIREDCHLNVRQCPAEHVCYVDSSLVTYESSFTEHLDKQFMKYKMGCEHYSVCQDRASHGEGPYGYEVTNRICCCHNRCEHADGVGQADLQNCPYLWDNHTYVNSATKHELSVFVVIASTYKLII